MDTGTAYLDEARRALRGHKRLAEGAIAQLRDDELFLQLDPESNSIAVLMKHIAGNLRSRFTDFLTSDGEKPDRHRDQEFEISASTTRAQLLEMWESGWKIVFDTLASLQPADLERAVTIRGEPLTVLQAAHRAVAHYAYHIGQIVFLAKHFRGAEWKTLSIARGQSEQFNAARKSEVRSQK
ncbi:MAG: DUF1572 domain-containing protein [Acidobacteriia bacterium]|nr:DUF1572 domain-containing protein [Terriglobia bacterium]